VKTVWKYPLRIDDSIQSIETYAGSRIVHVGNQDGQLCVWIEHNIESNPVRRHFKVHGTGHPIEPYAVHVGSAVMPPFVWHVYEGRGSHPEG
jgi:hypothetical protein